MRGVIYARYSPDAQREESIDAQIRENTAFLFMQSVRPRKIADFYNQQANFSVSVFCSEHSFSPMCCFLYFGLKKRRNPSLSAVVGCCLGEAHLARILFFILFENRKARIGIKTCTNRSVICCFRGSSSESGKPSCKNGINVTQYPPQFQGVSYLEPYKRLTEAPILLWQNNCPTEQ